MKELLAGLVAWGPWGLLLAALLDGAGIPVPSGVDVLIVYLASRLPDRVLLLIFLAVVGSTIGNLFLFSVARRGGQLLLEKRTASNRAMKLRRWFDNYGLLTVFISALVPLPIMPMKIFVLCAGALGESPVRFALVFLAARVPRYIGLAYMGRAMGDNAIKYLRGHVWHLALFSVVLFLLVWLLIRVADRRREPHGHLTD